MESLQHVAQGFPASAYTCTERNGDLLITSEMRSADLKVLIWSMRVTANGISGGVVIGEEGADAEQRFEGRALTGAVEPRTPKREVDY